MNEMFELEGASLTVHLPGDVDHPVSDEIRRESDRIMSHVYIRTISEYRIYGQLWHRTSDGALPGSGNEAGVHLRSKGESSY